MRLAQIDYFLEVADQLNFTGAAKALYISQPALSKQIALLEEELGTKLFERNSRKVILTPAGQCFRKDLLEVRKKLNEAIERAAMEGQEIPKTVRISCFDGRITEDYMTLLYQKINGYNRDLEIDLSITNLRDNTRALVEDKVDLMVTLDGDYHLGEGYSMTKLACRKAAIIYSPQLFAGEAQPTCIEDFADKSLLVPVKSRNAGLREALIESARKVGIPKPKLMENDGINLTFMNLERGRGYSIMSALVANKNRDLRSFPLDDRADTWIVVAVKDSNAFGREVFEGAFLESQP